MEEIKTWDLKYQVRRNLKVYIYIYINYHILVFSPNLINLAVFHIFKLDIIWTNATIWLVQIWQGTYWELSTIRDRTNQDDIQWTNVLLWKNQKHMTLTNPISKQSPVT